MGSRWKHRLGSRLISPSPQIKTTTTNKVHVRAGTLARRSGVVFKSFDRQSRENLLRRRSAGNTAALRVRKSKRASGFSRIQDARAALPQNCSFTLYGCEQNLEMARGCQISTTKVPRANNSARSAAIFSYEMLPTPRAPSFLAETRLKRESQQSRSGPQLTDRT
jgi:hypothetical protein